MLQPRLLRPSVAVESSLASLAASFNALSVCCPRPTNCTAVRPSIKTTTFTRNASHAAQGRANGPKDSAGRRLGAKKSASQYVIPGNIIFKQRGTKWFPGENVGMGKDHTIYATEYGYVRYYQDPFRHPDRKYIGVALEREGPRSMLPTPRNAPTRRRLGMYASPIKYADDKAFLEGHLSSSSHGASSETTTESSEPSPAVPVAIPASLTPVVMRKGTLMYREANFEIGRAAEKKGIKVREYDRGDRWLAWRKRGMKIKKAAMARAARATRKGKGKKSHKGQNPTRKR